MLTEKQRNDYIVSGGGLCPFCGSTEIFMTLPIEPDGCDAHRGMECICGKEWEDTYRLVDVSETVE